MSCKINLLFIPYHNTGAHFIDWSIQYVCKNIHNKDFDHNSRNWHHHQSISTKGFDTTLKKIKELQSTSTKKFENIGVSPLNFCQSLKALYGSDITIESSTHDQRNCAKTYKLDDYKKLISWAQQESIPVVVDYCDTDLLSIFYNNRNIIDLNNVPCANQEDLVAQYINYFFKKNKKEFSSNKIWDQREMVAVLYHFDKLKIPGFSELYKNSMPHLYYNTDDIWNDFPAVLEEICNSLDLNIDQSRFAEWAEIYKHWRLVHQPSFGRHLDRIVDSIVNNKYMLLDRFKIDFLKESIIQHYLIVKYNLNLKTWGLEKFPNNTQDLHKLLEPNIHTL
jgi:hypothetical protein